MGDIMLEDMFVEDNMDEEVYTGMVTEVIFKFVKDSNINLDEIVENKRRTMMKEFYILNSQISKWHLEKKFSIVDFSVALIEYGYSTNDVMSLLSSENSFYLREAMGQKHGKKTVNVIDGSNFFE